MKKNEKSRYNPLIKAIAVLMAVLMVFSGGLITCYAQGAGVPEKLEMENMLSDYVEELVDLSGAKSIDTEKTADNELYLNMKDGSTTVYSFSEPITYTDENGELKCKDNSIIAQTDNEKKAQGYDYCNGNNDYRIHLSSDSAKGVFAEYRDIAFSFSPISSIHAPGYISTGEINGEEFEDFEYADLYGAGTLLKYFPQINGIKEEIFLDEKITDNVFRFSLKTSGCTPVLNEDGSISLIGNASGEEVQRFTAPFAYDSVHTEGIADVHYTEDCAYSLEALSENNYVLTLTVSKDWLESESTVYPVTIDPTTATLSNHMDLPIHSGRTDAGTHEDNNAVGTSSQYGTSRTLVYYLYPSDIQPYAKINSAYYWTRELTGRTSDMHVGIYKLTSGWNNSYTWAKRPDWDSNRVDVRNINTASPDTENHLWYKFNITSIAQDHMNGSANRGFMMKYENEDAAAKNLRTFAQLEYSVSSMRPYTVINYTNDTTAPTFTDFTKSSATLWSNQNVTLTVKGAEDSDSGLADEAYSFSTDPYVFNWQRENTYIVSETCHVYANIRDKAGNVKYCGCIGLGVDKVLPVVSDVFAEAIDSERMKVTVSASDTDSGIAEYSISTAAEDINWDSEPTKILPRANTIYYSVKDKAGNISAGIKIIELVDDVAPSIPIVTGCSDGWVNTDVTLTAQSTDNQTGVVAYSFSTEEGVYVWQTENTKTFSESATVYVYAKDGAGNISQANTISIKIDKSMPQGGVVSGNAVHWTKDDVVLTVNDSADDVSGLNIAAYSFSTAENEYVWQAENFKAFTANTTVYVYVRDAADNIALVDTVIIDKIDKAIPKINSINRVEENEKTIITVDAVDDLTGVALYSFDGGNSWQENNAYELETNSANYLNIQIKDNAGNVAKRYYAVYSPEVYTYNNRVVLYNPNPKCESEIYYRTTIFGVWKEYTEPFELTGNSKVIYVAFSNPSDNEVSGILGSLSKRIDFSKASNIGVYKESNTDASFKYRNSGFDFFRSFNGKNNEWFFSVNSKMVFDKNINQIKAILPDATELSFIPKSESLYYNPEKGYALSVAENDLNQKYIITVGDILYKFNSNGDLVSVSNQFADEISLERTGGKIIVSDGAERCYTVNVDSNSNVLSVTDPANGVISYIYNENNKLVSVVDQAGVILGKYEYNENGSITKSMDKSIFYDDEKRVVKYLYDSGAYSDFSYNANTVSVHSSNEQDITIEYDNWGNISSMSNLNGEKNTYYYDTFNRLWAVDVNNTNVLKYEYDENGKLVYAFEKDKSTVYYSYDEQGHCIRKRTSGKSGESNVYYVYDAFGNVIIKAVLKKDYEGSPPEAYDESLTCFNVTKYAYNNGLIVKAEDIENNTISTYTYDAYGNAVKIGSSAEANLRAAISVTNNTYDLFGNLLTSDNSENTASYVYDAAGRTLLENSNGSCTRTIYDNLGRTIQSISSQDYDASKDGLPNQNTYADSDAGHTYIYAENGTLSSEKNRYGEVTEYEYSSIGTMSRKHFDIYDYWYLTNGNVDKIDVNGETKVQYQYNLSIPEIDKYSTFNKISYSNGTSETYQYSKSSGNLLAQYQNDETEPYIEYSYNKNGEVQYKEDYKSNRKTVYGINGISVYDLTDNTLLMNYNQAVTEANEETGEEAFATVTENHFGSEFSTLYNSSAVTYTAGSNNLEYRIASDEEENIVSESLKYNGLDSVLSTYTYDESNKSIQKVISCTEQGEAVSAAMLNHYNGKGSLISNSFGDYSTYYTYDGYNQLTRVDNESSPEMYTSMYTYDERGNILSKKVYDYTKNENITSSPKESISFGYAGSGWKDQLVSVNGTELTYDANGNVLAYGEKSYAWEKGRQLSEITDGENTYSYTYDENGIRNSKTVNGETTYINSLNGTVLSQKCGENTMYFQYRNGVPVGFVYNGTQYLYITNQQNDVIAITDADGGTMAAYYYDEWGKLLGIETAADSEEQMEIAHANPIRYRGYYYDNETGYYYLQSRYYDPSICRFINADSFSYINNYSEFSKNAYAYCYNCPSMYYDANGNTPQILTNILKAWEFIKSVNKDIWNFVKRPFELLYAKVRELFVRIKDHFRDIKDYFLDIKGFINNINPKPIESIEANYYLLSSTKSKSNNDSPTYLSDVVVDIFLSIFIFDGLSNSMIDIFGYDLTDSFFGLLSNIFQLIPASVSFILDIIKEVPEYIWEVMDGTFKDAFSVGDLIIDLAISFSNGILGLATEASFLQILSTWFTAFFPAELAMLASGILSDDSLSGMEKFTLIFVDSVSIILSSGISFAISSFDIVGPLKIIATIASTLLPVLTDMITKIIIKKE